MVVANRLRETRKKRRIPQKKLADATGYSTKTIGRIERGEQAPSAEFMFRMAAYFQLLMEDLFEIEE